MLGYFSRSLAGSVAAIVLLLASSAEGAVITYQLTPLAGNSWVYDYTLTNDSLGAPLQEFTVFFDRSLYRDLAVGGSPDGWDSLVVQPDPLLPDDGFLDALALNEGLAVGGTQGGFAVQFTWLGSGTPGSQPFAIINPVTFATLEAGTTSPVPAPGAGWLLATAVGGLAWRRWLVRAT
jgi:hypothetical protein